MALKYREEIVGKRFLSVRSSGKLKLSKISEWEWRAGVVRSVSSKNPASPDLTVLVEFDDVPWNRREWVRIHGLFQVFMVESSLLWAQRQDPFKARHQKIYWPALNFKPLVDKVGVATNKVKPVEFLEDQHLDFYEESQIVPYKEDLTISTPCKDYPEVQKAIRNWLEYQSGQSILLTTPSVLLGYRLEVYRAEGTTQWYTAVIQNYNEKTRELLVLDDTVLEEHNEDPALIQMKLLGDGVVDSILNGGDVGVTPRIRRSRACQDKPKEGQQSSSTNHTPTGISRTRTQSPSQSPAPQRAPPAATRRSRQKAVLPAPVQVQAELKEKLPEKLPSKPRSARERKRKPEPETKPEEAPEPEPEAVVETTKETSEVVVPQKKAKSLERTQPVSAPPKIKTSVSKHKKESDPVQELIAEVTQSPKPSDEVSKVEKRRRRQKPVKQLVDKPVEVDPQEDCGKGKLAENPEPKSDKNSDFDFIQKVIDETASYVPDTEEQIDLNAKELSSKPDKPKKVKGEKKPKKDKDGSTRSKNKDKEVKVKSDKTKEQNSGDLSKKKERKEAVVRLQKLTELEQKDVSAPPKAVVETTDNASEKLASVSSEEKLPENSTAEEKAAEGSDTGDDSSMHYKKLHLLNAEKEKEKSNSSSNEGSATSKEALSAAVNVNHSITDQIAKLAKVENKLNEDSSGNVAQENSKYDYESDKARLAASTSHHEAAKSVRLEDARYEYGRHEAYKVDERHVSRQYDQTESKVEDLRTESRKAQQERSSSRMSDTSSTRSVEEKRSHGDDFRRTSKDHSPASSPLVVDKNEPVTVYRDPELLKKDMEQRQQIAHPLATLQQFQRSHAGTPHTTTAYPTVHTPIPHPSLAAHRPLLTHPLYSTQAAALSQGMGSAMLPHLTTPVEALSRIAQQHNYMQSNTIYPSTILSQQQQLLSFALQHGSISNVTTAQLELLWTHKYPTLPVPPPWMLVQYQEELLRDINVIRERQELIERERLDRDRLERIDRDRKEREKLERERVDKERAERDRAERERQEKERQERERREREQEQRQERERILKESALATEEAVDKHFTESLRLASQKAAQKGHAWTHSITMGLPKPPVNSTADHSKGGLTKPQPVYVTGPRDQKDSEPSLREQEAKLRQVWGLRSNPPKTDAEEWERERARQQQHYEFEKKFKEGMRQAPSSLLLQQQMQQAHDAHTKALAEMHHKYDSKGEPLPKTTATSDPKGYAAYSQFRNVLSTYASRAAEKQDPRHQHPGVKQEPGFSLYGYQPFQHTYISQDKLHGLMDVKKEEKSVDQGKTQCKKLTSPPPLIKDTPKGVIVENKLASRPGSSDMLGRPGSPRQQISPRQQAYAAHPAHLHNIRLLDPKQSPLRVASPEKLSAAIREPMEIKKNESVHPSKVEGGLRPAHMGLSNSDAYSKSLIQGGLVPNPIYSHTSAVSTAKVSESQISKHGSGSQHGPGMPQNLSVHGAKRVKPNASNGKDIVRKKPRVETSTSHHSLGSNSLSIASGSSTSNTVSPLRTADFIDSFKSFVENKVHEAFFQDQDLNPQPKKQPKKDPEVSSGNVPPKPQPVSQSISTAAVATTTTSLTTSSTPVTTTNVTNTASSSIVETINRVANGMIDTDSDTLSAPSPPPHIKHNDVSFSPSKSGNHRNLKKAWLQRHSDEDKGHTKNSDSKEDLDHKGEETKNLFNNFGQDGGGKSHITSLPLPNGNLRAAAEDSTSSASESESQGNESNKRKIKTKRRRTDGSKKVKSNDGMDVVYYNKKKMMMNKKLRNDLEGTKNKGSDSDRDSIKSDKSSKKNPRIKDLTGDDKLQGSGSESETKDGKKKGKKNAKENHVNHSSVSQNSQTPNYTISNKPLNKYSIATLKKNCESFLQDGPCAEVTPKLMKCRECKMTPSQRNKKMPNIFCRFYAFRRLRFSQKGYLMIAGFSQPVDAEIDDIAPWMPNIPVIHPRLDVETAKYIIENVGDKFCDLVMEEKEARALAGDSVKVAWKRQVQGVREMCDVCDTTLFNMHWVCHKCGFVVCLDCYKVKKGKSVSEYDLDEPKEGEEHAWLTCSSNRQPHEPDKLMLTQIIPGNALWEVGRLIHEIRPKLNIPVQCPCGGVDEVTKIPPKNGLSQQLLNVVNKCITPDRPKLVNGIGDKDHGTNNKLSMSYPDGVLSGKEQANSNGPLSNSVGSKSDVNALGINNADPLSFLAEVASMEKTNKMSKHEQAINKVKEKLNATSEYPFQDTKALTMTTQTNSVGKGLSLDQLPPCGPDCACKGKGNSPTSCSTLKMLLMKKGLKQSQQNSDNMQMYTSTLDDIIQSVVEKSLPRGDKKPYDFNPPPFKLTHYIPKNGNPMVVRHFPVEVHTLTETSVLFPDVPHSWLCDGRLVRLHDPDHKGNFKLFQKQWIKGTPVLVSAVNKRMNMHLWKPETFCKEFGQLENDLVDCETGVVTVGHKMHYFWEGFESIAMRLIDDNDDPMVLKLKDWPPGDDFSDMLPTRFADLMQALPLPEYTHRNGRLNLASRLPDFFVRPDLGPKMYNAYGLTKHNQRKAGTTNLHLDISDAVNVMVYIGIPEDDKEEAEAAALKSIEEAGVDQLSQRRVKEGGEIPGALWHIYDAEDADKIRDLLNKVGKERGEEIEPDNDPIHDQSWYLDRELRERLYKEYQVQGYAIVQCAGDAIFIPAGAPHQVQNLHSCIKVAEDFVSPEHLKHCFNMTQQFRHLSDTHSNHEDKLQVKNIIFHAVKDAVAVLKDYCDKENKKC